MHFQQLFVTAFLAFAVDDVAAKNPVSRTLQEQEGDPNRYVVYIPKSKREELYEFVKSEAGKIGGQLEVEVPKKGVIAVTFPDSDSIQAMQTIADDKGFTFEQDQIRSIDSMKPSLRTARKLAEDIPWGIEKTYERDGIPTTSYYDDLMTKKVCVIDSGYLTNHEDLPNGEVSVNGGNYGDTSICSYHGSHVSGTIGAVGGNGKGVVGVFPGPVGIRVAKVFTPFLGFLCLFTYSSGLIGAAQNCLDGGAEITNMSLGGAAYSAAEDSAFEELFEDGMINIAASGNGGPGSISYPATYSSVISVGATDINDAIASFSGTNNEVDIAGPGVDVRSTVGPGSSYDNYDGTSMATPHVAGATLVLWNKFPSCSNEEVRNALEEGADDLGAPGRDNQFGNGRLNYWASADILAAGCGGNVICEDSDISYNGKDCAWVGRKTNQRCGLCNESGTICASDECPVTCGTC